MYYYPRSYQRPSVNVERTSNVLGTVVQSYRKLYFDQCFLFHLDFLKHIKCSIQSIQSMVHIYFDDLPL